MKVSDLEKLSSSEIGKLVKLMHANLELFLEIVELSWMTDSIPETHKDIYAGYDLMNQKKKDEMFIVCYRGYSKSTKKRNAVIREICLGLSRFIVFVHETMDQAKADLDAIQQEIKSNAQIKFLFGDLSMAHDDEGRMVTKWASESARFYRRDTPSDYTEIKCIGMNKKFRGFHSGGMRINRVWFDDFESEDNTRTAEMRKHNLSQITAKILPARDPHNFWAVYQGTIVHPDSYMAGIQKKVNTGVRCDANRDTGMYFERQASSDPETYGVGTWPERFTYKLWKSTRDKAIENGKYPEFLQEYYNIPIQAGEPRFLTDMITQVPFKFGKYKTLKWLEHIETGKKTACKIYIGVDPAYSFAKRSDSTAICVLATTHNGSYIILEQVYGKYKQDEKIDHIRRLYDKYNADLVNIEAYGAALEMPQVLEDENRRLKIRMNIEIFNERIGKSKKYMDNLETYINSGKLHYVPGVQYIETMITQMEMFSGEERYHDDLLDGVWLAREKSELPYDVDIERRLKALVIREQNSKFTGALDPYKRMSEMHARNQRSKR